MMRLIFLTCLLALFYLPAHARKDVEKTIEYQHYDVHQRAGESLLTAIKAASPVRRDGRIFHGYTEWKVSWRYQWNDRGDGGCALTSASANVQATITLPHLASGSPTVRAQFKPYIAALREHELGHYRIGVDAARDVRVRLQQVPPQADCRALKSLADRTARATVDEYKARNRQYDIETEHGRTQGAWLPRD
jgi:predicted secreted Zn-dependent protease